MAERALTDNLVAIIDIGSNSIRLVVYNYGGYYPYSVLNQRVSCRLGEGLTDGDLVRARVDESLSVLRRFWGLLVQNRIGTVIIVATAAVRRAQNGGAFVDSVREIFGEDVWVLSQDEEASLAARGLMSHVDDVDGIICDLGGGSTELIRVDRGVIVASTSLDFGHLSLISASDFSALLAPFDWLSGTSSGVLYGIGGSFRAFGLIYQARYRHPISVLHGLSVSRSRADALLSLLVSGGEVSADSSEDGLAIPRGRASTLPQAGQMISAIFAHCGSRELIVSGTSLRDGLLNHHLAERGISDYGLHDACRHIYHQHAHSSGLARSLKRFIFPLADYLGGEKLVYLAEATCFLADICWNELHDLKGVLACERVLALPTYTLSHRERALLSKIMYHRYSGAKITNSAPHSITKFLDDTDSQHALCLGLALRFILDYSGQSNVLIDSVSLRVDDDALRVIFKKEHESLLDELIARRLKLLANALAVDLKPEVA